MRTKIIQDTENPIGAEVIAQSIVSIAAAMKKLNETRLSRRAILRLVATDTGLGVGTVEAVLNSLEDLEKTWCKPLKVKP